MIHLYDNALIEVDLEKWSFCGYTLDFSKYLKMKEFEKVFKEALNEINSINITKDDFNFNLIESKNNTSNNNILGD